MVLLSIQHKLYTNPHSFIITGTNMVDFIEIPLDLQLKEAHHWIKEHLEKGRKFSHFLSPMFLWQFPTIMDNQISVEWDTITNLFDRSPAFPITLIDTEILDGWCANPSVWEVERNQQHSRHVLAMVHHTLVVSHKGRPIIVFEVSFVYIPAHQAQTSLSDTLKYLVSVTEDCVVLVSMPIKLMFSPQPRQKKYYTLLPINGDPGADHSLIHSFARTTLLIASREGQSDGMVTHVKLPPYFGSSKWPKTELIKDPVLARGPLWKSIHFIEHTGNTIVHGRTSQPICQELLINLGSPGSKIKYTRTGSGCALPLTVMACMPGWEDYFDLSKSLHQMVKCLMDTPLGGSADNPVTLSDAATNASAQGVTPKTWALKMKPRYSATIVTPWMRWRRA